jgi:hypothetical protein
MLPRAPAQTGTALAKGQEICLIDKNVFERRWKEIRGKSKEWWSLINDIDLGRLDKAPDKFKKYVMLLQVKYGYTKKFAGEEIDRRMAEDEVDERDAPKS